MNSFVVGGPCIDLFKKNGSLFNLERAKEKRWEQSGCKNRFTFSSNFDIGDLSEDSVFSKDGTCFSRSDLSFARRHIGKSFFGEPPVTEGDVEKVSELPHEISLSRELASIGVKPSSKLAGIREFLSSVGRGLPIPWRIKLRPDNEKGDIRAMYASISILLSLEQEGLIWVANSQLGGYRPNGGKYVHIDRGAIALGDRKFCFPPSFREEIKKIYGLPEKTRHVVVPVAVSRGKHANVLILDRKKKTVSFFEPHGIKSRDKYFQGTEEFLKKFIDEFGLEGYKGKYDEGTCPWSGPQAKEPKNDYDTGYCMTWTQLFIYCKMKFPELSDAEINYALTHGMTRSEIRDTVERFGAFAWDEGKKAAKKSKRYEDDPVKAFYYGKKGVSYHKKLRPAGNECVEF
ncbi:hypothetical protein D1R32_gp142 [Tunisvirus fontaine2]|uniref:Uncharacterized protein n=1 Tax=Tunisvirus fontaine2 TaxID=1421067 RepID=V9SG45_9VIRU|nr:hypothetical protein D1R32_gp142 [Tunisvirus fontaine2]AHC54859.1 hypothetical protein TNS_ORF141 [Tunisvirus fontaine2]